MHQLLYCKDIPTAVVIDQAIALSRRFSTEAAGAFINGVLDAIAKGQHTQETDD